MDVLNELYEVILSRIKEGPEGSYTAYLASKGKEYVARKVGEEALEVIIASLTASKQEVINEVADLIYHLMVLMALNNVTLDEVLYELRRRRK